MAKKINNSGATYPRLRDSGPKLPRVDPALVAAALGAETTGVTRDRGGSPMSVFLLRTELVRRLESSGGRPALEGVSRRVKIPVSEQDWQTLEELAAALADAGFTPSAGQVASVLLTLALRSLADREPQAVQAELREQVATETRSVP